LVTEVSSINLSGILFSVTTHTVSFPLTPTVVKFEVFTALKAYSNYNNFPSDVNTEIVAPESPILMIFMSILFKIKLFK